MAFITQLNKLKGNKIYLYRSKTDFSTALVKNEGEGGFIRNKTLVLFYPNFVGAGRGATIEQIQILSGKGIII